MAYVKGAAVAAAAFSLADGAHTMVELLNDSAVRAVLADAIRNTVVVMVAGACIYMMASAVRAMIGGAR